MTTLNIVQVSLQLFCCLILLFPLIDLWLRRKEASRKAEWLLKIACLLWLLLISDSLAYIFRGNTTTLGIVMVRVSNFGLFFLEYLLQPFLAGYMIAMVEEDGNIHVQSYFYYVIYLLVMIGFALLVLTQFTGFYYSYNEANEYVRSNGFIVSYLLHIMMLLTEAHFVFQYRKYLTKWNKLILLGNFLAIIVPALIQLEWYGISFANIGFTIALMSMFVKDSIDRTNASIRQMQQLVIQQKKSEEMRRRILLSTVEPHFLFNSLNAIEGLIDIDPDMAGKAIRNVSKFLRASTDTLNSDSMVQITTEIGILESYLSLIEMRFWGTVTTQIEKPREGTNYLIPPFTLQPLAENAINHGIRKNKKGCGNLKVQFTEEEYDHVIRVIDDGVGFDAEKYLQDNTENEAEKYLRDNIENEAVNYLKDEINAAEGHMKEQTAEDGHVHMGIRMVRERLALMCEGTLTIRSAPGEGTTCEIRIPK